MNHSIQVLRILQSSNKPEDRTNQANKIMELTSWLHDKCLGVVDGFTGYVPATKPGRLDMYEAGRNEGRKLQMNFVGSNNGAELTN